MDTGSLEREGWSISAQALRSLEMTDGLSPELRSCVHEFGAQIVNTLMQLGIKKPRDIRTIVHSCWMGAREPHQRHGLRSKKSPVADQLDWLLEQQGAKITAATLLRILNLHGMTIVPNEPGSVMVEASMETVTGHDLVVTKYRKHQLRLRAAIEACSRRLWPQIHDKES